MFVAMRLDISKAAQTLKSVRQCVTYSQSEQVQPYNISNSGGFDVLMISEEVSIVIGTQNMWEPFPAQIRKSRFISRITRTREMEMERMEMPREGPKLLL